MMVQVGSAPVNPAPSGSACATPMVRRGPGRTKSRPKRGDRGRRGIDSGRTVARKVSEPFPPPRDRIRRESLPCPGGRSRSPRHRVPRMSKSVAPLEPGPCDDHWNGSSPPGGLSRTRRPRGKSFGSIAPVFPGCRCRPGEFFHSFGGVPQPRTEFPCRDRVPNTNRSFRFPLHDRPECHRRGLFPPVRGARQAHARCSAGNRRAVVFRPGPVGRSCSRVFSTATDHGVCRLIVGCPSAANGRQGPSRNIRSTCREDRYEIER